MGITRGLVRSVFPKSRSIRVDASSVRSRVRKRRWSSVKSYLCGDEFNSISAEEEPASARSSEATVTQPTQENFKTDAAKPMQEGFTDKGDTQCRNIKEEALQENKQRSTAKPFGEEEATIVIQSAFRGLLLNSQATLRQNVVKSTTSRRALVAGTVSPNRVSVGTPIEVQTENAVAVLSIQDESIAVHHQTQQKTRIPALKQKEDWDYSTVSSNVMEMRIQNRLEATARRERALAYAFSQQLRICSKRKQSRPNSVEPNMGWSWLQRWMAARLPESSYTENTINEKIGPVNLSNQKPAARGNFLDVTVEEWESCGSNDVSVQIGSISASASKGKVGFQPVKHRLKATRGVSKCRTSPSSHHPKELAVVSNREYRRKSEKRCKSQAKAARK